MIRLLILDVDGTLMPSGAAPEPLSNDFLSLLNALHRQGIRLATDSARPYHELRTIFHTMAERMFFICGLASVLMDGHGRTLHCSTLSTETVRDIVRVTANYPSARICFHCPLLRADSNGIASITISCQESVTDYFRYLYQDCHWKPNCQVAMLNGKEASFFAGDKGEGVRALMDYLHIPPEETMYIGDDYADLPALESVGHPCIRDTAPAELRKRFACQTADVYATLHSLLSKQ